MGDVMRCGVVWIGILALEWVFFGLVEVLLDVVVYLVRVRVNMENLA